MTTDKAPIGVTRIASVKALRVSIALGNNKVHSLCSKIANLANNHHDHA
jgi:hypothetical protein